MSGSSLDRTYLKLERLKGRLGIGVYDAHNIDQLFYDLSNSFRGRKGVKWCHYVVSRAGRRMTSKGRKR